MARKRRRSHKRRTSYKRRRRNPSGTPTYPARSPRAQAKWGRSKPRRRKAGSHRRRASHRRGYAASRGKGQHRRARTYRVRNRHGKPLFHVRGWRARRRNPGTAGIVAAAVGLAAGLAATVVASYAIDVFLSTQSSTVQTGVLVGLAAGAGFLIGNPAIAAGVATGLLVVPLSKAVYSAVPALANPSPMASTTTTPVVATAPAMSALHRRFGALHMGKTTGHKKLRALHMGSAMHLGGPIRGFVPGLATSATRFR